MREAKSPVILTAHIRSAIEDGGWIEVECLEPVERGGNTYRGGWKVYVCDQDSAGTIVRAVHVVGRGLTPRIFKTITGLMSFCMELQMHTFICPFETGKTGVWKFETSRIPAPD